MLDRLQRGIETLYRIDTQVSVDDFVIDEGARDLLAPDRSPREQLLLAESGGELEIGLFVDRGSIANLEENDPSDELGEHNLQDFLLAIEGVSHFVYVVWNASADRPVSQLELELQAEVDKFVTCVLTAGAGERTASHLHSRLFRQFLYEDDLGEHERWRYEVANANASRYGESLRDRFVAPKRITDMLAELRRFYRLGLDAKLDFIRQAA